MGEDKIEVIVRSKVRLLIGDMWLSQEVFEALDKEVKGIMERACKRAKANKRRTIFSRDL